MPPSPRPSGGSRSRWCSRASSAPRCLSFSLSFDDFIITNLNAGNTTTFPMYVWGVAQRGVPMQVNVVGTLMFVISIAIVLGAEINRRRQEKALVMTRVSSPGVDLPGRREHRRRTGSTTRSAPPRCPGWTGPDAADLVVVGGGYLGLWTALLAKERDPGRDVVLLEGATCGHAASGRNGGFCEASLTHGFGNGRCALARRAATRHRARPREPERHRAHDRRSTASTATSSGAGSLAVATQPHQVGRLREEYAAMRAHGLDPTWLDRRRAARAGRLADLPRRRPRPRRGDRRARPARLGTARRVPRRSGYGSTSTRRSPVSPAPGRGRGHHVQRPGHRAACGPRHQRLPAAAPPAAADDGARSTTTR